MHNVKQREAASDIVHAGATVKVRRVRCDRTRGWRWHAWRRRWSRRRPYKWWWADGHRWRRRIWWGRCHWRGWRVRIMRAAHVAWLASTSSTAARRDLHGIQERNLQIVPDPAIDAICAKTAAWRSITWQELKAPTAAVVFSRWRQTHLTAAFNAAAGDAVARLAEPPVRRPGVVAKLEPHLLAAADLRGCGSSLDIH